jgi:hypothetical protein
MTTPVSYPVRLALPEIPVECYAGTGLDFTVPVLMGNGQPANLVNVLAARAQVRLRWESPEVLHSWTTDVPAGMVLVGLGDDEVDAGVRVIATGEETATWQAQWARLNAFWDLEILDADGQPHRLCRLSPFIVNPEITREL